MQEKSMLSDSVTERVTECCTTIPVAKSSNHFPDGLTGLCTLI
jgi:hypothetical protein